MSESRIPLVKEQADLFASLDVLERQAIQALENARSARNGAVALLVSTRLDIPKDARFEVAGAELVATWSPSAASTPTLVAP